ncbi:MAG: ATPase V [Paludibacteraceae bacterium]|nr:ATPase V [Paludibacteraceae bacterium]
MKKYTFLVFHRDYEPFLEQLRDLGVVHITQKAAGLIENNEALQAALQHEDELRHLLQQGAPDQLLNERKEVSERIAAAQQAAQQAQVWGDFDAQRISELQAAGYTLRFFSCPTNAYKEEWGTVINEKDNKTFFVVVESEKLKVESEEDLLSHATPLPLPEKSAAQWNMEVEHLNGLLAAANARIEAWQLANKEQLEKELVEARQQIDWQRVTLSTDKLAEGALCLLEGFCPIDKEAELNAMLAEAQVYYEETDPQKEDATPIKLRNNKFTQLFECLTGMYGWPNYNEFDPTPILAPFYLLFFAMCMGDAGYGILLIIFGLLLTYKKINIEMFDGLGPIIAVLGAGTFVVGLFLGTFMGIDLYNASWYPEAMKSVILQGEIAGYNIQMVCALAIGVFHICLAMVIKAVCYTLQNGFRNNVSTWGWALLIIGTIITLIISMVAELPENVTKITLITIAVLSALGIYIFNTPGRNPLINIGSGLWDTYNMVTGLLGDTLSYVRLFALGLAGGMLGSAFNNLGMMILGDGEGSVVGMVLKGLGAVAILVVGHLLNVALSGLGAFVHPLRLTFVEYFKNVGYEGKGEMYSPFKK